VLCVVRVRTLEDAIELVSANAYANGTAISTGSGEAAWRSRVRCTSG
jgi:malonate-semialdehyde dehydrogenase (acetylating)/methylmalonate-semialdehyde dehydrogenase